MVRVLVAYASMSGNTEEVAQIIAESLREQDADVVEHYIDGIKPTPDVSDYDVIFLGSYTWNLGETPEEVKDFVYEIGYKPDTVYVFGTGDTQFGEELYCIAADKLAKFYNSPVPPLKIEQSPRGAQEKRIKRWVKDVLAKGER